MRALLIVDLQNDFCPGGAMAVKDGDAVVPVLNSLMQHFPLVVASRDWHPEGSAHFTQWPVHCLQGTIGAGFHPALNQGGIHQGLFKGTEGQGDGYSAFEATNLDLADLLRSRGISQLYIGGLATDTSVRATALDATRLGFTTSVILDAVKAVDFQPGDGEKALEEMRIAGVNLVTSIDIKGR